MAKNQALATIKKFKKAQPGKLSDGDILIERFELQNLRQDLQCDLWFPNQRR